MEKVLKSYLKRLTNLSGSNRSLILLRLISDQTLDIHEFDFLLNEPSFSIIQKLLSHQREIPLCRESDSRDSLSNALSQRLKKLKRIDDFIFHERGSRDLYVGWPFVQGKFNDNTLIRCPLIFFPVEIQTNSEKWVIKVRKDVNITLNKSFLLAYAYYNDVDLGDDLIEQVLNDFDRDSTVFRTQLYELLKGSALEINFNQENFTDKLKAFRNYRKDQLSALEKTGSLKLNPEAVLGIFPQAGSYLVPDYVKLLDEESVLDIEEFFSSQNRQNLQLADKAKFSDKVKEENTYTPFELDASQETALNKIKAGHSLVIQGPPGTGKSQLISNLICDHIARGKNVLLVCQKRAALDVVYGRLREKQLHDFVGLVHDFKNDRKSIFEQIAKQIEAIDEYRQKNNGLDSIFLERNFQQASRKIDLTVEELDQFKEALYDETECGKSVKELYLTSSPNNPHFAINQEYREFHFSWITQFRDTLSRYLDYKQKFNDQDLFWTDGPSFESFDSGDLLKLRDLPQQVLDFNQILKRKSLDFSQSEMDYESALHFQTHRENLKLLISNLDNTEVFENYKWIRLNEPKVDEQWLIAQEGTLLNCFKGIGPETSLRSSELGRFQEALERAIKARKGLFSWFRWKLLSKDKIFITRVLVANNLKSDKQGFSVLLEKIDNRLNFEHISSQLQAADWLQGFPTNFRKIDIQNWFFYQKLALKSYKVLLEIRTLREYIPVKDMTREEYLGRLNQLINFLNVIPLQTATWSRYLSDNQIRAIILGKKEPVVLVSELSVYFDLIVEHDKLKTGFSAAQLKIIEEAENTERKGFSILDVIINSLSLAWINHIEIKHPILRAVSSLKLDHLTKDLQQAISDKMDVSEQIVLLKLREKTYEELEYNRLNNLVTYRDLHHQVTKKRRIWPIRKVIDQFDEEVFSLLPCWMASPESASAIFPMEQKFDLVIFDEASQCFAERGIPAMYRGRQVVIAGDQQQLKPNDLYRVRWEENEDQEQVALEVDSLLDLASNYVEQVKLTGHYRSKSLALIDFSNKHFYGGRLRMLPYFKEANDQKPPIHFLKVHGVWERNSNEVEAKKVAELVKALSKERKRTIGIVTFNISQQNLIQDLLEKSVFEGSHSSNDLFVKNIENVQGDERDVIIFSTAYAKDSRGKLQLRFGTLNQAGGENRLNVAVTRAREEIYLVTSIEPDDLAVADTKNTGPKLLKEYLNYAQQVSNNKWKPDLQEQRKNHEWYLSKKLMDLSKNKISNELPYADLTVKKNGKYNGLLLTDDQLFYQTISSKEAYAYLHNQLIEKSWPYQQFFSREYWVDPKTAKEKLDKFLLRVED